MFHVLNALTILIRVPVCLRINATVAWGNVTLKVVGEVVFVSFNIASII